jgi:hypothetical protein
MVCKEDKNHVFSFVLQCVPGRNGFLTSGHCLEANVDHRAGMGLRMRGVFFALQD